MTIARSSFIYEGWVRHRLVPTLITENRTVVNGKRFPILEDVLAAKAEGGISAIVTRNKTDYSASEILVLSPEEYLAKREPAIE